VVGYRIRNLPREFQFDPGAGGASTAQPQPKLVLLSALHLDSGPYRLELIAYDGGEPAALTGSTTSRTGSTTRGTGSGIREGGGPASLSGSTTVVVSVEDSNDHEPTFDEETVVVKVGCIIDLINVLRVFIQVTL